MDKNDKSRIIGDFLEINADIVYEQHNSKYPKFIAKLIAMYRRRRLIGLVKKLGKSNMMLSKNNLAELFAYTFNNFPPSGSYKNILVSKVRDNYSEAIVSFNDGNTKAIVSIDQDIFGMELNITHHNPENNTTKHYSLTRSHLFGLGDEEAEDIVRELNKVLLNLITEYLISNISSYKH